MRSLKSLLVVLVVLLAVSTAPAWLQAQTASSGFVSGTVSDPTGAVVPGVDVKLEDPATGTAYTTTTNAGGRYAFPAVAPAVYKLTASMQGFRTATVVDFRVEVAKSYTQNITLEVGAVAQVVEVTSAAVVELQTTDSTVGTVIGGDALLRLPTSDRSASSLLLLQPLTSPGRGVSIDEGGQVAGARSDQTTYLIDGGDATANTEGTGGYNSGFDGTPAPSIPVPIDSIEEFRVSTTNPNATFSRSQGGQVALATKRGTNSLHGSVYWYHQNDNLNSNTWDLNRVGEDKPELKDNRYGFSVGGPIVKDKTFLFGHYEGRRFPRTETITRLVPTATMRQGILRFDDGTGTTIDYDLATSTLCGASGTLACDPRGLGISPVVASLWALLPAGNDPALGDGLNTIGFRTPVDNTLDTDFFVGRFDQTITDKWSAFASYRYSKTRRPGTQQVDITTLTGGTGPHPTRRNPLSPRFAVAGVTGQITPNLTSESRISWLRHWWEWSTQAPFPQVAGTNAALQLAGEPGLVDEPFNIDTQNARSRDWNGQGITFSENLTWVKGAHTIQFGGSYRHERLKHTRVDKVIGGLTTAPIYWVEDGSFITVPTDNRPATLATGDITRWNDLYSATLGILDHGTQIGTRDGDLNPLPLTTPLKGDVLVEAFDVYAQDIWRANSSLTITYGITYQLQVPPEEALGRQMVVVFADTGEPIFLQRYFDQRAQAARAGQIYNPEIAYSPVGSAGLKRPYSPDYNNFSPRLAAAWNPSFDNPFFGNRKTVIRGGYGVTYTRMNGVGLVMTPILGVGLAEALSCNGPDTTGTCTGALRDPSDAFRIGPTASGWDGSGVTIPAPGPPQIPFGVASPFGETLSFSLDPGMKLGLSHSLDLTWQRELPGNIILEFGYVGRLGKNLTQAMSINATPFFQLDLASGTTLGQAFDAVALELRAGVDPTSVTPQPWFENQFGAGGTAAWAGCAETEITLGQLADSFLFCGDFFGAESYDNLQVLINSFTTDTGKSWYHAGFVSLRKRLSQGLLFDVNYTLGKSIDLFGLNQENIFGPQTPFDLNFDRGFSLWDRRHTLNSHWYYELPMGRGRGFAPESAALDKVVGGWYISGIYTASSGLPDCVSTAGNYGDFFGGTCARPAGATVNTGGKGVHSGVVGSNGVGTSGGGSGSGLNLFSDPESVFNQFRRPLISVDGRAGNEGLRGLSRWNVDVQLGKKTAVTERVSILFSLDFLNIFNHVEFTNPSTDLNNPSGFGVLTSQFATPRSIQFGFRIEF